MHYWFQACMCGAELIFLPCPCPQKHWTLAALEEQLGCASAPNLSGTRLMGGLTRACCVTLIARFMVRKGFFPESDCLLFNVGHDPLLRLSEHILT